MKNKDFFYLQYNKISWKNQEKTKINSFINTYIIKNVLREKFSHQLALFDIGFGIGFFIRMVLTSLGEKGCDLTIEGCEPSQINYDYWQSKRPKRLGKGIIVNTYREAFQNVQIKTKFDFITAIYVFPHFLSEDLEEVVKKNSFYA